MLNLKAAAFLAGITLSTLCFGQTKGLIINGETSFSQNGDRIIIVRYPHGLPLVTGNEQFRKLDTVYVKNKKFSISLPVLNNETYIDIAFDYRFYYNVNRGYDFLYVYVQPGDKIKLTESNGVTKF